MFYNIIEIKAQTSSFRNPEFQNFHKSYLLPPPTTVIGLIGAALGLSPKTAQDFFYEKKFSIGCFGKSKGIAKDLWKYNDFKVGSIVLKDILYDYHFILVLGSKEERIANEVKYAFENPIYALTLGNSDSLAKVIQVTITQDTELSNELSNCLVSGDIIEEVFNNANKSMDFSIYQTSDPITYDMPIRFDYKESDYGIRSVSDRKAISIIGESMKLNVNKSGVRYKDIFIPVFKI